MRNYWLKIIVGALGVFVGGMVAIHVGRALFARAKVVAETDSPITIPLPFVPFRLDGERVGTFDRIVIRRKSPHKVAGVDLAVKLDDPQAVARLAGCSLRAELSHSDPTGDGFTLHDALFSCLREPSAAVERVGVVRFLPGRDTLPLVVDTAIAARLRKEGAGAQAEVTADSIAEAADRMADSIEEAASRAADSVVSTHERAADSLRRLLRKRADSARERARTVRDSVRRAVKAT
jgi:hypothetical protein